MEVNGIWVGWGLGDHSVSDDTVRRAKAFMRANYRSYAGGLDDTNVFDQQMQDVVEEMQQRLADSGLLTWGQFMLGVLDLPTQLAMGFKKKTLPVFVTVEGHMSNMFFGPVADTATQLEGEGLCRHQPTGYNNGALPFNNQDGVNALAENISLRVPNDANLVIGGYSQGMIVVYDYLEQYGIPARLKGVLMYGNPNRKQGSIAPWARPWVKRPNTHGLDPYKRFGLPNCVDLDAAGIPYMDVWREDDIFAQNGDDEEGALKAAVYEAVARTDFFSNPYSLAASLGKIFTGFSIGIIFNIIMAISSGIGFLADNPNPHYSPYDLTGGRDWVRGILKAS